MKNLLLFCFGLILLIGVSCTSTQHVALNYSDKKTPNIEIFMSELQKPTKEYEVISYIETSGAIFATKKQLLCALKRKAKELNGDAVIDVRFFYIPHIFSGLPSIEGVVVKYK